MTEAEREQALELLRDPKLLDRILADFDTCGLVGGRTNKLIGYLAAVSPQTRPAARGHGAVLERGRASLAHGRGARVLPEEERIKYSRHDGQSLYYMGETNLKHKILAIVEGEGAESASYALKLLQSRGRTDHRQHWQRPTDRPLVTQEYHVEGPVMIFLTTTAIEIDEELLNRCLMLTVDESREQTEPSIGCSARADACRACGHGGAQGPAASFRNAQRLLRPLEVLNPFADQLLSSPTDAHPARPREIPHADRHHRAAAPVPAPRAAHRAMAARDRFIEVNAGGHRAGQPLAPEVLGRCLDELPPQTRRLLGHIRELVKQKRPNGRRQTPRFSRKELRRSLRLESDTGARPPRPARGTRILGHPPRTVRAARSSTSGCSVWNAPEAVAHVGLIDVDTLRPRLQR